MRIALIADIHGNSIALDAVLADCALQQVDSYWFLGDLVDGHDPSGVLARSVSLPNTHFIVGNTDHYIVTGHGPPSLTLESVRANPGRLAVFQEVTASWAWSKGWLCATGWFEWLCQLPIEERATLPNGQRLLAVHASPGYVDGPGIGPHINDAELAVMLQDCAAEVVCVGHTHTPFTRVVDNTTVVNPGSVSNPLAPDMRAGYAILEIAADGCTINHRRVAYDHQAVIEAVRHSHHPAAAFIIDHQLGNRTLEGMMRAANARRPMINWPSA